MDDLIKIYGDAQSGNCYKLKLITAILNIEHEWLHVDILAGDTKDESFLTLNPAGKIPLLLLPDGRCLSESNAILNFLAAGSELLPDEPFLRAKVLQWQFFEQYSHEPYIAVARFIAKYLGLPEDKKEEYVSKQEGGNKALAVMEKQLLETSYLLGESFSVADISLYAYTHVAEEGGFNLSHYPAIQAWLARISKLPNYTGMN